MPVGVRSAASPVRKQAFVETMVHVVASMKRTPRKWLRWVWLPVAGAALLAGTAELRTSWLQSHLFTALAGRSIYSVRPGGNPDFQHPHSGPYDIRLGYSTLNRSFDRLQDAGWEIQAQALTSSWYRRLTSWGLFPIYQEKSQAGLRVLDRDGVALYEARWPRLAYSDFQAVPPVVVETLLFVENREILEPGRPYRNPAVEWGRLARATTDFGLRRLGVERPVSGGSTLATQIEKIRHSPGGVTGSPAEKMRQMLSGSLRAYQMGRDTRGVRRRIVCDYLNSIPLAAVKGYGEVVGLGDGLAVWFGADFEEVNRLLAAAGAAEGEQLAETARAYRQVLTLLLAIQRPTEYLSHDGGTLEARVEQFLQLLGDAGVISPRLRDHAIETRLDLRREYVLENPAPFSTRKGTYAVRAGLMKLLGEESLYGLDRLDLSVTTTLDETAQRDVATKLRQIQDPEFAAKSHLIQQRLLADGNTESVIYSVTLYERSAGANLLRVQADNYDNPLNINEGTKLELGSTAKLRTLTSYLEVVGELYARLSSMSTEELAVQNFAPEDGISHWVREFLSSEPRPNLEATLEVAMARRYSASPAEAFFTGGGRHRFSNFDAGDNGRIVTVRDAFQRSVNLPFIRLMRELVHYHTYRLDGVGPELLADFTHPARQAYLERFAQYEGRQYLNRFYIRYDGLKPDEALQERVNAIVHKTPARLAVIYRSVRPDTGEDAMAAFLVANLLDPTIPDELISELYQDYAPGKFSLADRAYLAGIHPLDLWLLEYLETHPGASLSEVIAASGDVCRASYQWLFRPTRKRAQDRSIRVMLEIDAFAEIHRRWQRLGYPFGWLVPSYATAIGSSGDTPSALAELVGVILNDGVRQPNIRVAELHYASATPYETIWRRRPGKAAQALPREVAALLRRELVGVVESGTGRRAQHSIVLSSGEIVPVGGKTGTGDNRFETYAAGGQVIDSRVINRTAAFVFFIGDRLFGVVTAFVPGEEAAAYSFTSSLPVQVFKNLSPVFQTLLEAPHGSEKIFADARSLPPKIPR